MEFLKELFADNALSYEDFVQAVTAKGIQLADVTKGYITKEDYDNEIQKRDTANQNEKRDHAVDIAIMQAKGKNPKAIKALLDMEKITINEDGKVEGVDLSPIQKSDSYLFDTETVTTTGTGAGGIGKTADTALGGNTAANNNAAAAFEAAVFGSSASGSH